MITIIYADDRNLCVRFLFDFFFNEKRSHFYNEVDYFEFVARWLAGSAVF